MNIWYIHGAGGSERSFVWLRAQLPKHTAHFFTYPVTQSVSTIVDRCLEAIGNQRVILIGHSLGGIIATACARFATVSKLVTLCAPFGGVTHANLMAFFRCDPLIHDLRTYSRVLADIRAAHLPMPHLSLVGTHGLPFHSESNDGVLTVASQTALQGPQYKQLPINHFEMLLSDDVASLISDFIR
jgi:pimeloyl-ACP methyl ester carboxylesterase